MGSVRNLTPAEILDQLVQAGEILRDEERRIRNVVFMGMGEPFHNEANVYGALDALLDPRLFHHPARYLLVSTVGIPDAMVRFARRFAGSNLALSLHSPRQELREKLVPIARRYNVALLRRAIEQANRLQRRPLLIEYLMLGGLNDELADADRLIAYLDGLDVHVNLIPFNHIEFAPHLASSERASRDAFAGRLKDAGITTTIRYSLGADISAACGQLVKMKTSDRSAGNDRSPSFQHGPR
jgi:23S rRNA (adenine2503-C2)-methyltransferase